MWSSPEWLAGAASWLDRRLAAAGIERTGEPEPTHVRPWATVMKVPTTAGLVWMKAAGPGTAFEIGLYEVLVRVAPDQVLRPIATDRERAWMVLPDGGAPLGQRLAGRELVEALGAALVDYGRLQLDLVPHVDEILAAGVPDMRPEVVPRRFAEALDATASGLDEAGRRLHRSIAAMAPTVARWCDELAASGLPATLDHNDLHFQNVLGGGTEPSLFYDWGDSVVGHPLGSLFVPLNFVRQTLDIGLDDPVLRQIRDDYLSVFRDVAPGENLVATLEPACHVAKIARTVSWDRALRAALDDGDETSADWRTTGMETLASVLHESYLGDF